VRHVLQRHEAHVARRRQSIRRVPQARCLVIRPSALRTISADDASVSAVRFSVERRCASFDLRGQAWRENKTRDNERGRGDGVERLHHDTSPVGNLCRACGNAFELFLVARSCDVSVARPGQRFFDRHHYFVDSCNSLRICINPTSQGSAMGFSRHRAGGAGSPDSASCGSLRRGLESMIRKSGCRFSERSCAIKKREPHRFGFLPDR